jgi:hypothetical protein
VVLQDIKLLVPREGPKQMYVKTDLKFAALDYRNLRRTRSKAGKATLKLGGGPPRKTEIASFVRYPAKGRAGLLPRHSTALKEFHGDGIRVQPTCRPAAQAIAIAQGEAVALA